jgi:hypothetical protein
MDEPAAHEVGARWLAAMRAGDWEAAWRQTDRLELPRRNRQRGEPTFRPAAHHLHWDGTPFAGRSVLVRCEHGLGDTLQYLRFVPLVAAQAREMHLMAQPPLVRLLEGAPGLGQVHDGWQGAHTWPRCEVEIEVMELAYAFRATPATVPPPYPQLAAQARARSRLRLPRGDGRLRVGLLWAASDWDTTRSIPWDALRPLLGLRHLHCFALQQGRAVREAEGSAVEPLWRRTAAVEDAARAMLELDLVVSIDGMPAHLAATLGVPTWLVLKHQADWRWADHGERSPWYPSMRLFRQSRPGDWHGVIERIAAELAAHAEASARTAVPDRQAFSGG